MGTVEQAGRTVQPICVENATSADLTITQFTSSCECLSLRPLPAVIRAGASRRMELQIDLRDDPKFVGDLGIDFAALDARSVERLRGVVSVKVLAATSTGSKPMPTITVDGNFADWADVPTHKDPAGDEHDTDHKGRRDEPGHVEHPDVDLLEYKVAHDATNLYFYFRARGVIGRTQAESEGKRAGRYYAIGTIDVDQNEKTGYWLHEGGFYPTSGGYDVNAEIEWYNGEFNTGHYINHGCTNPAALERAFVDQSSGQYRSGLAGPYRPGFIRIGPGTYKHYTEWVYHADGTITFVRDKGPVVRGIITGAMSPDGHELEMKIPMKGFLVDQKGAPLVKLGRTVNISMSLEASSELAPGGKWASDTAAPLTAYHLFPSGSHRDKTTER